jgi:transposase-like protein
LSRPGSTEALKQDDVLARGDPPEAMADPKKYPDELIEPGVRLALESERPIAHIAADLGIHAETLRKKVRQAEADSGARPEMTSGVDPGEALTVL